MSNLRKTPLYHNHVNQGARLVPFAGWSMPVQYHGILEEAQGVRKAAGLFDVSHMGKIRLTGKDVMPYLRFLLTNDVMGMSPSQAQYTLMCYPDGGVIDDLIAYMVSATEFLLIVNGVNAERDFDWMKEQRRELDVEIADVTDQYALIALQGPASEKILSQMRTLPNSTNLDYFHFAHHRDGDKDIVVARTGYTGEDGFEIMVPADQASQIWDELLKIGTSFDLKPAGLGARDILRLEMGYALYGHELDAKHTPISSGLKWAVKLDQHDFIGRDALDEEVRKGSSEILIYFYCNDRRIPREKSSIFFNGLPIGAVVSGAFSPHLECSIGSGFMKWNSAQEGPAPKQVEIKIRDSHVNATLCRPPFIQKTSLKKKPPVAGKPQKV